MSNPYIHSSETIYEGSFSYGGAPASDPFAQRRTKESLARREAAGAARVARRAAFLAIVAPLKPVDEEPEHRDTADDYIAAEEERRKQEVLDSADLADER